MKDPRYRRLIAVMVVVMGILFGRFLLKRRVPVVMAPADYTEVISQFDGTPTR